MTGTRRSVVMLTSSYPRFPGDAIGTFMEPIAQGVASRGFDVELVAPSHPRWRRAPVERGVRFHLYPYAPHPSLSVFGYAGALRADVGLRFSAIAVTPLAVASGTLWTARVASKTHASLVHAHWAVPGGVMGMLAAAGRPLIISLHGSDIFVAERHALVGMAARAAFRRAAWVTACSEDLAERAVALGASPDRITVVPYGVDGERFKPESDPSARREHRHALGVPEDGILVVAVGRLARKKGFEYLIDAASRLRGSYPSLRIVIAGSGDLDAALRAQAAEAGVADVVRFLGTVSHDMIPSLLAAADIAAVPSVHDEAGNVDGLPNTALEIMASGTPLVATRVGGIGAVAMDGETARLVPERDAAALADVIAELIDQPERRRAIGEHSRQVALAEYSWSRTTDKFISIYNSVLGF